MSSSFLATPNGVKNTGLRGLLSRSNKVRFFVQLGKTLWTLVKWGNDADLSDSHTLTVMCSAAP